MDNYTEKSQANESQANESQADESPTTRKGEAVALDTTEIFPEADRGVYVSMTMSPGRWLGVGQA